MAFWRPYVPVAQRRANAARKMGKLRKKGKTIQPVEIDGRTIAHSFWGKGWCKHLESFSDFANRLPRGRTYVRNGSVCHLEILPGRVEAMVAGSSLYNVTVTIKQLKPALWKAIKEKCSGQIGSMLELLQGKMSGQVMAVVTDRNEGLFPKPGEIELCCSCPDWAVMCKHVAAVLYGVGSRLDGQPELLFSLRGVDAEELISAELAVPAAGSAGPGDVLGDEQLGDIFGIDLDADDEPNEQGVSSAKPDSRRAKVAAKTAPKKNNARDAKPHKPDSTASKGGRSAKAAKNQARANGPAKRTNLSATASPNSPSTRRRIRPTGKSVTRLRKKLGLSVADFAGELSVTSATVYRWEATNGPLTLQSRTLNALQALHEQAKTR